MGCFMPVLFCTVYVMFLCNRLHVHEKKAGEKLRMLLRDYSLSLLMELNVHWHFDIRQSVDKYVMSPGVMTGKAFGLFRLISN
jgi:hypothetical protein